MILLSEGGHIDMLWCNVEEDNCDYDCDYSHPYHSHWVWVDKGGTTRKVVKTNGIKAEWEIWEMFPEVFTEERVEKMREVRGRIQKMVKQ